MIRELSCKGSFSELLVNIKFWFIVTLMFLGTPLSSLVKILELKIILVALVSQISNVAKLDKPQLFSIQCV